MDSELVKVETQPLAMRHELSVEEVLARIHKVHQTMEKAMVQDHHYGVIPGTKKPSLLKPGAELLNVMFRLDPQYQTVDRLEGDHLTVTSTCTLWHIPTGQRWGSGQGSCSTRESKYAWRDQQRTCPECGKAAIIKGKAEYGGGWLCFKKKEGCGAKYRDGDELIESQATGRIPNPDLPDTWNTVTKMANKRSLVAAVLNVTAASDIFTQDLEDMPAGEAAPRVVPLVVASPEPVEVNIPRQPSHRGETIDAKAERLFNDDPAVAVTTTDRNAILGKISACHDLMKAKGVDRANAWRKYIGDYDEKTAPIAKLQAFLSELQAVAPVRQ